MALKVALQTELKKANFKQTQDVRTGIFPTFDLPSQCGSHLRPFSHENSLHPMTHNTTQNSTNKCLDSCPSTIVTALRNTRSLCHNLGLNIQSQTYERDFRKIPQDFHPSDYYQNSDMHTKFLPRRYRRISTTKFLRHDCVLAPASICIQIICKNQT
ncbi:hypothetical protein ABFX02_05G126500 [Erythranthe guttata]